ncbi:MAG: hypothetical protein BGO78_12170 [Chloroflexi bacterium 44-23]|nr:MAG: hypothetical protein BGO78_12170 [Chloroflexi bacterium 44-23]
MAWIPVNLLNYSSLHSLLTSIIFPVLDEVNNIGSSKILYLATVDIVGKWNAPIFSWKKILNQLNIYFDREI